MIEWTFELNSLEGEFIITPAIGFSWENDQTEFQIHIGWFFWVFTITRKEVYNY